MQLRLHRPGASLSMVFAFLPRSGPASRARSRQVAVTLACVFLAAVGVRLALSVLLSLPMDGDQHSYWSMATRLAAGETMEDEYGNRAFYSAGYPILLGVAFWLFESTRQVALVVNALLGGVASALLGGIAWRLTGSVRACALAGLAWGVGYVENVLYSGYLLKENLSIPLLLAQILVFLCLRGVARPMPWCLGLGMLFGAQAVVGSSGLFALPVMGLALLVDRRVALRRRFLQLAVIVLGTVLAAAPWLARNEAVIGEAVLNTNGGFNLYIGNHPGASGMFEGIRDTPMGRDWDAIARQGEVAFNRQLGAEAIRHIAANPVETVRLSMLKVLLFWKPPLHDGYTDVGGMVERLARMIWLVEFLVLGALAAWRAWSGRRNGDMRLFMALLLAYTALHAVFYVIYRYRLLIMPVVCLMAVLQIEHEWRRSRPGVAATRPGDMKA